MKKKKAQAPNIYNFIVAAASDQNAASQMLRENPDWLQAKDSADETALHYLAIEGDSKAVKFLVAKGAEINTYTEFGSTPLTDAASVGNVDVCLLLIENGADVNAKDVIGYTAMHYAARSGKEQILEALLKAGGRADAHQGFEESVAEVVLPRKRELMLRVLKKYGYN